MEENSSAAQSVASSGEDSTAEKKSHLNIGCFIYPRQDQIDFTGPFEVLSRIPNATVHVIGKVKAPFRDVKRLILTPDLTIAEALPPSADMMTAEWLLSSILLIYGYVSRSR